MSNTLDPKEFQSFDDAPTNTGYNDLDWDEIRPRYLRYNSDEIDDEDEPTEEEINENFEGSHFEGTGI